MSIHHPFFLENKYTKWYYKIIFNASQRTITTYTERHHIIPKSLGGNNDQSNIVKLSAREHFICHRLLTKMTKGSDLIKMNYALSCLSRMSHNTQRQYINSRTFKIGREAFAQASKGRKITAATKLKLSEAAKKFYQTPKGITNKQQKNISGLLNSSRGKGRSFSNEHREKLSNIRRAKSVRYEIFDIDGNSLGVMTILEFSQKYNQNYENTRSAVKKKQSFKHFIFIEKRGDN